MNIDINVPTIVLEMALKQRKAWLEQMVRYASEGQFASVGRCLPPGVLADIERDIRTLQTLIKEK